ncbi:MAG: Gx transporter family protein, partial [Spirochaetales bacterium]|nr:Gx transporter family protein [Spirochaetales bacterium]
LQGTLFSYVFLFSFTGSFSSGLFMIFLNKFLKTRLSLVGISIAGAFVFNCAQLLLSWFLLFGRASLLIAPPLLGIGLVSSIILGIFAREFCRRSVWIKRVKSEIMKIEEAVNESHVL